MSTAAGRSKWQIERGNNAEGKLSVLLLHVADAVHIGQQRGILSPGGYIPHLALNPLFQIKQFCKRSILALFVVFSLANLCKIYGEYKSYSYLTDGNGERNLPAAAYPSAFPVRPQRFR